MGQQQSSPQQPIASPAEEQRVQYRMPTRTTYHSHDNFVDLLRIYKLFLQEPYNYVYSVDIETVQQNCCNKNVLKVVSPHYASNLEAVLNYRRKNKAFFVEKQIWYIVKTCVNAFAYMESAGIVMGAMNPSVFNIERQRFITVNILHLLPDNQHQNTVSIHNYYSPQKIQQFANQSLLEKTSPSLFTSSSSYPTTTSTSPMSPYPPSSTSSTLTYFPVTPSPFKSQVFSFALLVLEIATVPMPTPKFHKTNLKQLLWNQIRNRFNIVQERYSQKLVQMLEIMLREDIRVRGDWAYLKYWLMRNGKNIDIGLCLF